MTLISDVKLQTLSNHVIIVQFIPQKYSSYLDNKLFSSENNGMARYAIRWIKIVTHNKDPYWPYKKLDYFLTYEHHVGGWKQLGLIPKVGKTYELDFEAKLLNLDNPVTHTFLGIKMRGTSGTQWGARIPAVYSEKDKAKWKVCTNCKIPYD